MTDYKNLVQKAVTHLNNNELDDYLSSVTDTIEVISLDKGQTEITGKTQLFELINTGGKRTKNRWEIKETNQVGHKLYTHETFITTENERTEYMFIYEFDEDLITKIWYSDK